MLIMNRSAIAPGGRHDRSRHDALVAAALLGWSVANFGRACSHLAAWRGVNAEHRPLHERSSSSGRRPKPYNQKLLSPLFLIVYVTYLWRMKVMMIVLLCFAGYGCGSDQEKKSEPKYAYSFDHDLFTAAFPLEPAVEYQTHNEIRITLVTSEITYLLHVGSIRKDAQSTLRDMTDEEALAHVADGFRNMYAEFVDHELKTSNFQGASSFELLAPEVDNPMGDYSWMKAILLQDKVIQIILSAPEKRIVDRERKAFMNQFQLK